MCERAFRLERLSVLLQPVCPARPSAGRNGPSEPQRGRNTGQRTSYALRRCGLEDRSPQIAELADARAPGIEPPPELRASGLGARDGWNNAWTSTRKGLAFIETLHTYFVVLDKDGRFQISGVPAGDYDLALRLYEPPGDGCLVSPVGSRIVRFHVTEEAARAASFELGEIPVSVAIGPRIGDIAPDFTADTFTGGTVTLSGLRGRYVLLDFWATWCGPCVANLPAVARFHETFAADSSVTILGLNLDDDVAAAKALLDDRKLPWAQAHLGGRTTGKDDVLSRYAISFIPTYILIEPDGKLVYRGDELGEIGRILRQEGALISIPCRISDSCPKRISISSRVAGWIPGGR